MDVDDEVEAAEVEGEVVDGEVLIVHGDPSGQAHTETRNMIAICHHDGETGTRGDRQAQAAHHLGVNEGVHRAGVHKGPPLYNANSNLQHH